ncbi:MAG TPA: hypothetical protein VFW86_02765 [Candidatus Limnocylindrales bacterium]|nr:hypothetical protein [Candidatus Limnocylindrales bacterium]
MAVSDKPWGQFSDADYPDADAYCRASLIDLNPAGQPKTKDACKLRVREPGGDLNRNGVHAAAAVLAGARGGVDAPAAAKRAAARKLVGLYGQLNETPPDSVRRLAS